jgi:hypothetical protein
VLLPDYSERWQVRSPRKHHQVRPSFRHAKKNFLIIFLLLPFSNDDELHPGTILVSLGARYKLYCSNMSRTFFIDPQPEQKANYEIMLSAYTALIEALVPGQKISAVLKFFRFR